MRVLIAALLALVLSARIAVGAVALDALSVGVTTPGPNNHMGSWGAGFTGGVPFSGFISPSASATLAIVFIGADTTTPGTWTVTLGGNAMTQIGTQVNLGSFSLSYFALLNPPSGSLTLNIGGSNLTSNTLVYGGITFTGTATSNLAAAVQVTTATGTSTSASVTTSTTASSACMAVAGFGGATQVVSSTNGTNIDTRSGFSSSGFGMAYYTGAGAAITGTGTLAGSAAWGAEIALVNAPGGCAGGGGGGAATQRLLMGVGQ
jgi:hypothetical protein